jgi:hypothetical protein
MRPSLLLFPFVAVIMVMQATTGIASPFDPVNIEEEPVINPANPIAGDFGDAVDQPVPEAQGPVVCSLSCIAQGRYQGGTCEQSPRPFYFSAICGFRQICVCK